MLLDITYSSTAFLYYLAPPIITIAIALIFRQVIVALLIGIITAVFMHHGLSFESFFSVVDSYALSSLTNSDNMSVLLFSLMIGGMVSLLRSNGSLHGVVNWVSQFAKSAVSAQFSVWLMGVVVFFDDYANSLIVGNTMRGITDKFGISREKLAYIVDSTAAPVASIAFITTWVGMQMKYFAMGSAQLGLDVSPLGFFAGSLKYAFYPFLSLIFILIVIYLKKDFGPMYKVEVEARKGRVNPVTTETAPIAKSGWAAAIPIMMLIITTLIGVYVTGAEGIEKVDGFANKVVHVLDHCNSFKALIWGSFSGLFIAVILSVFPLMVKLQTIVSEVISGFGELLEALLVLVLAWTLSDVLKEMGTGEYLGSLIGGGVPVVVLPLVTFVLSGLIAFSTGSSWSTMAILFPIVWNICDHAQLTDPELIYHVGSMVLAGSVFGDHCSPISDTTILSSMASGCDHISHVRTQMPYAVTVAGVSLLASLLSIGLGMPAVLSLVIGGAMLFGVVWYFGKKV